MRLIAISLPSRTFRGVLKHFPNLIVLNTMSKAWGCAALRLGMAFASKEIIDIFNKVKYPYNVNLLTQQQALEVLKNPLKVDEWVKNILQERSKVMAAFLDLPICREGLSYGCQLLPGKGDGCAGHLRLSGGTGHHRKKPQ